MQKYSFNNNKIYGGPIEQIFGSDGGFALFLNGMGFRCNYIMKLNSEKLAIQPKNLIC